MKRPVEDHAARFDARADDYDDDASPEYKACVDIVVEQAAPEADDVVLDLGCGTGAIGLALASRCRRVVGRDISEAMLERCRQKAAERGLANVTVGQGRFRAPAYNGPADMVVSNYALHHLSDTKKRAAIAVIADYQPRRVVLGDIMFFGTPDPDEPWYDPAVDDPATVGTLVEALTDVGFAVTGAHRVHDQVGVLVAEQRPGAEPPRDLPSTASGSAHDDTGATGDDGGSRDRGP